MSHRPAGFEFFHHCPVTGVTTWHRHEYDQANPDKSRNVFAYTQDVEPVLEANKAERWTAKGRFTERGRIGAKLASIPAIVIEKWKREHNLDVTNLQGYEDVKKLKRLLNDPDYRYLRVAECRA